MCTSGIKLYVDKVGIWRGVEAILREKMCVKSFVLCKYNLKYLVLTPPVYILRRDFRNQSANVV